MVSNKKLKKVSVNQKPTSLIEYELQNTRFVINAYEVYLFALLTLPFIYNSGHKIQCVLWEDDADALQYYIDRNITTADPIVMILQLAKINIWESKTSSFNIDLIFNPIT